MGERFKEYVHTSGIIGTRYKARVKDTQTGNTGEGASSESKNDALKRAYENLRRKQGPVDQT